MNRLILWGAFFIFSMEATAANMYRYTNDKGVVVLDYTMPQRYVDKGYSILDENGHVIEEVPAKPTEAELKKTALERKAREKEESLKQKDEDLLKNYSSVADIEARRDRKVEEIAVRLTILKGNIVGLMKKLEALQADAARTERQGQEISPALNENIQSLRNEIVVLNDLAISWEQEKTEIEKQFASDIKRFKDLRVQSEKRRGIYRPPQAPEQP